MMGIDNTKRFTGLADIYAKARPTYPDAAIDYVLDICNLSAGSELADIGCGTGISSQLFTERGLHVIGVEPNFDMRQKAGELVGLVKPGTLRLVDGTAENTTLADSSVQAVVCAQAFHWFKPELALLEFQRILKPGGWTVLFWNERDESDQFTRAYGDAFRKLTEIDAIEGKHGASGMPLLTSEYFCKGELTHFENEQVLDRESLILRAFSASYAPKETGIANRLKEMLNTAFERFQKNSEVSLKYTVAVYSAQKA
ncbi:MAG: methyltransferase domain-containing protein [Candidatus Obscuribacterales bacterium]|nr:methyltransferase domain-containing protein [Candidatus Obscuribacterales bacterium]